MQNQMKIVIKLKQKKPVVMLKKNNIFINLKKKKHIKLVFSSITKKSNKENQWEMDYNYAYEMDRYDNYRGYSYNYGDDHCRVYDEDYEDYNSEYCDEDYEEYINEKKRNACSLQHYYDTLMIN
jgi:hypothetical protein